MLEALRSGVELERCAAGSFADVDDCSRSTFRPKRLKRRRKRRGVPRCRGSSRSERTTASTSTWTTTAAPIRPASVASPATSPRVGMDHGGTNSGTLRPSRPGRSVRARARSRAVKLSCIAFSSTTGARFVPAAAAPFGGTNGSWLDGHPRSAGVPLESFPVSGRLRRARVSRTSVPHPYLCAGRERHGGAECRTRIASSAHGAEARGTQREGAGRRPPRREPKRRRPEKRRPREAAPKKKAAPEEEGRPAQRGNGEGRASAVVVAGIWSRGQGARRSSPLPGEGRGAGPSRRRARPRKKGDARVHGANGSRGAGQIVPAPPRRRPATPRAGRRAGGAARGLRVGVRPPARARKTGCSGRGRRPGDVGWQGGCARHPPARPSRASCVHPPSSSVSRTAPWRSGV